MAERKADEKVKITRILMIDDAIRAGGYPSIEKLARRAEVNPRTIERDIAQSATADCVGVLLCKTPQLFALRIAYLRDMYEAPIEYDRQRRGYCYTEPNFFIKSVVLTEGELFSVALFDRLLEQYDNTPLAAQSAVADCVGVLRCKIASEFCYAKLHAGGGWSVPVNRSCS